MFELLPNHRAETTDPGIRFVQAPVVILVVPIIILRVGMRLRSIWKPTEARQTIRFRLPVTRCSRVLFGRSDFTSAARSGNAAHLPNHALTCPVGTHSAPLFGGPAGAVRAMRPI